MFLGRAVNRCAFFTMGIRFFVRGSNPLFPTKFLFSFHLFPVHRFAFFSKGLVGGFLLKKGDRIC